MVITRSWAALAYSTARAAASGLELSRLGVGEAAAGAPHSSTSISQPMHSRQHRPMVKQSQSHQKKHEHLCTAGPIHRYGRCLSCVSLAPILHATSDCVNFTVLRRINIADRPDVATTTRQRCLTPASASRTQLSWQACMHLTWLRSLMIERPRAERCMQASRCTAASGRSAAARVHCTHPHRPVYRGIAEDMASLRRSCELNSVYSVAYKGGRAASTSRVCDQGLHHIYGTTTVYVVVHTHYCNHDHRRGAHVDNAVPHECTHEPAVSWKIKTCGGDASPLCAQAPPGCTAGWLLTFHACNVC